MNSTNLLITDPAHTVQGAVGSQRRAYTAYGGLPRAHTLPTCAYIGQARDRLTGCYHLGNGRRTYNPSLMRLHSPDRFSPFGRGGLNAYAYCLGDPINRSDPTGNQGTYHPARAVASAAGAAAFLGSVHEIAVGPQQLPTGREAPLLRAGKILTAWSSAAFTFADSAEIFMPEDVSLGDSVVDYSLVVGAVTFWANVIANLGQQAYEHGWSSLRPSLRGYGYALGEITLIGPTIDLVRWGVQQVSARDAAAASGVVEGLSYRRTDSQAHTVIEMTERSGSARAEPQASRVRRNSV